MGTIRDILVYFNLLSMDVVLGSMAGMLFFADLMEVKIPLSGYFLLGMAVWSIYTLDHLKDARIALGMPQTPRHQFHKRNFLALLVLSFICILIGMILLLSLDELRFILIPGSVLGFILLVWMGLLIKEGTGVAWLKETFTAVIYVAGISLAPFAVLEYEQVKNLFLVFALIYFLAALVNLLILSFLDADEDQKNGFGSILVLVPKEILKQIIGYLGVLGLGILLILAFFLPSYYYIHIMLLALIIGYHLLLFFSKNQKHVRIKSEASFLLPFILLLF